MFNWLNTWPALVLQWIVLSTAFSSIFGAEVCYLEQIASYNVSRVDLNPIENSDIESCLRDDEVQSYLEMVANVGVHVVTSVAHVLRKHPLKALTMFLALQNSNSPYRVPTADALSVTNLNQTLTYIPDGPAVPILPMTITEKQGPYYFVIFAVGDSRAGNVSGSGQIISLSLYLPGDWRSAGSFGDVNGLLSNLFFMPARGYRDTVVINSTIGLLNGSQFSLGFITINPFSSTETPITTTSQSITAVVTGSSNGLSSSSTKVTGLSTTASSSSRQGVTGLSSTSVSSSVSDSIVTTSSSSSRALTSELPVTSIDSKQDVIDSMGSTRSVTLPGTEEMSVTTMSGLEKSSDIVHLVPAREFPYALIGGVLGGVVLCMSMVVGLVYYLRKKYSSGQQSKDFLPAHQAPSGGGGSEKQYQNPAQHSGQYDVSTVQAPINSSYTTLPITSPRYVNSPDMQPNDVPQSGVPLKTFYSFLPVKGHYETSLPRTPNYNEAYSTLHKAAAEGDCSTIEVFLGFNVPIDSRNEEGYTALHLAAQAGKEEACKLLLSKGANKNLLKDGKTALSLAQENGHRGVVHLIA